MNSSESLKIVTMLAAVFDVPAWTPEHRASFQAAIADLPFESAKQAAARWIRTESRRPLPADIRKLAEQVPIERALPAPIDMPLPHPGEGIGGNRPPVVMPSDYEHQRAIEQYAANIRKTGSRVHRPDIAYEARRLGLDPSPFLAEDPEPQTGDRGSLSEVVARAIGDRAVH